MWRCVFILFVRLLKARDRLQKDSIPLSQAVWLPVIAAVSFNPSDLASALLNRYVYRNIRLPANHSRCQPRLSTILAWSLLDLTLHVVEDVQNRKCCRLLTRSSRYNVFAPKLPKSADAWHRDLSAPAFLTATSPLSFLLQRQQRILVREETINMNERPPIRRRPRI